VSTLELDLMEYIHNREAVIDQAVRDYGPVGAHQAVTERHVLAQVRRVIEGRYSVCGSAAL
jgi:hypothetical protein